MIFLQFIVVAVTEPSSPRPIATLPQLTQLYLYAIPPSSSAWQRAFSSLTTPALETVEAALCPALVALLAANSNIAKLKLVGPLVTPVLEAQLAAAPQLQLRSVSMTSSWSPEFVSAVRSKFVAKSYAYDSESD